METPGFPDEYKPEAQTFAQVLEGYRASAGLDWSVVAPSPAVAPGACTGSYVEALDAPRWRFCIHSGFCCCSPG